MKRLLFTKEGINSYAKSNIYHYRYEAAGKSTVAEALAKRLDKCVHLRGDIFRKMIVSGREEMWERPSEEALSQLELRKHT